MSAVCTTIDAGLNASPADIVAAVNVFLGLNNPISIVSLDKSLMGRTGERITIKLCYNAGGANYGALLFQGNATQTADALANAFFTANPTYRASYILDISNPYLRNLVKDACLVLVVSDFTIDTFINRYMAIVEPTAPVAAGASGTFDIIGSTGPIGGAAQITAVNQDAGIWAPGEYGWAALDPATSLWQAWSGCC